MTSKTKKQSDQPTKLLSGNVKFSKVNVVIFALLFGLLGGYAIYKTFAASSLVTSVEAESMVLGGSTSNTATIPPGAPQTTVQSGSTASTISMTWAAPNSGDPVDGYKLYKNGALTSTTTGLTYTYTGLACGTTYKIGLTAFNSAGESDINLDSGNMSTAACSTAPPAPTPSTSTSKLEGESMTLAKSSGSAISETGASGGKSLLIYSNATAQGSLVNTGATSSISVLAKSTACNGVYAKMVVKVDGVQVISTNVSSTTFKTYSASVSLSTGAHTVAVAFTNDAYTAGVCDRNLFVDKISSSSSLAYSSDSGAATLAATTSPIGESIIDSTASNGQAVNMYSNGDITGSFKTTAAVNSFSVIAKADSCSGVGANMIVSVDGKQVLNTTVAAAGWQAYTATNVISAGNHTLGISFTNDSYAANVCDRNLYVDKVDFFGDTTPPSVPAVSLGSSSASITAGQSSTLTWSSNNATACTASGGWSGAKAVSGSISTGALNQTTTYSMTCTGSGGSASANTTVTVTSVAPTPTPPPPAPSSGSVVPLSGSLSPSQVTAAAGSARPVTLRGPFTITGSYSIPNNVRLEKASVQGIVYPGAGSSFDGGSATGFDVTSGADNWQVTNSSFDGGGFDNQNLIWDAPGGNGSSGWTISGNTFRNFYMASDPSVHAEALYIGGLSANGLIANNTFTNNGNTAHIFFTWFGSSGSTSSYPKNICVRGNSFGPTYAGPNGIAAYFSIQFRDEIPVSSNIKIDPSNKQTGPQAFIDQTEFQGTCQ